MPKFIIKLFSPIAYVGFVTTTLLMVPFVFIILHNSIFTYLLFILLTLLTFWLANKVLMTIENLAQPVISDHFRQSSILYGFILAAFFKTVFFNEYHFGLNIWSVWVFIESSFVAILINALYIFWLSRKLFTTSVLSVRPLVGDLPSNKVGALIFFGPALVALLMIVGFYVTRMHNRIYYSKNESAQPVGVMPPGAALPPSLDGMSATTNINPNGLPLILNK